ncbi:site-specific tyrosine recombinase XerC [Sulfitobacter sp. THAF37]|uniref:tyrosine-type recombinase/integrase n=1 Tax=Sulfitobacter sp. THAF37 TaxID=2587855 RepID=UPI001267F830|nr:site-specific integrase [Sulfitobacter sp. THAF37]QFT59055.1 site-specific tyrosine recombinase XerC [Sulfitobacter sp. THAF37]
MTKTTTEDRAPYLVWPKGKASWQIRDKRRYISTGATRKSDADAALIDYIKRKDEGANKDNASAMASTTLRHVLDVWADKRKSENPATWARKWRYTYKIIYGKSGKLLLTAVDQKWADWYERERYCDGVEESTVRQELATVMSAWRLARKSSPPLTGLPVPEFDLPPASEPREHFLTRSEADRLIKAADADYLGLFIRVCLATGGRHSAVLGLTWSRVDLDAGTIDLRDRPDRSAPVERDERGRRKRSVRQKPRAQVRVEGVILDELRAAQERAASPFVIEHSGKGLGSVHRGFKAAVERAGLDPDTITPHVLRHSAITWLMQAGEDIFKVAGFAGHTSTRMIERVYGHHHPEYQTSIAKRLAQR